MRLDVYLVEKGFFETRNKAKSAIDSGAVCVDGQTARKCGQSVSDESRVVVSGALKYVSRGGLKLERAIEAFGLDLTDVTMLDVGASTGGFTDCALQNGAKKVFAVDVGSGQLHHSLRGDARVTSLENTDVREADKSAFAEVSLVGMDVSFISVTKIAPHICDLPALERVVCLIKPQFECGRDVAKRYKGVIRDRAVHLDVIHSVTDAFDRCGWRLAGLTYSPVQGGDGNIEYLALFTRAGADEIDFRSVISSAFDHFADAE